jgi:starvation-inducible DNA-binding protein
MPKKDLINALKETLADSYTLYLKIQNFHWNVVGEEFLKVHELFEEYYNELFQLNDELAERIRSLDSEAPASFVEFLKLTNIKETSGKKIDWKKATKTVLQDKEIFMKTVKKTLKISVKEEDVITESMMIDILTSLEKQIWMLKSILK